MQAANFRWKEIPTAEHAGAIALPILPPPGLLSGRKDPSDSLTIIGIQGQNLRSTPPAQHGEQTAVLQPFIPEAFCRMIAKIGHGMAVAELGTDAFIPLLPDYILRKRTDAGLVIGSASHGRVRRDRLVSASIHYARGFFVAHIQLFAQYGFNPYQAVIGTPVYPDRYLYSATMTSTQTL